MLDASRSDGSARYPAIAPPETGGGRRLKTIVQYVETVPLEMRLKLRRISTIRKYEYFPIFISVSLTKFFGYVRL